MTQQPKEKKRGRTKILLIILIIFIFVIPAVLYVYLKNDHFLIIEKRADYTFDTPYAGDAVYQTDGDVKIPLAAEDLYWLIDEYRLLDLPDIPDVDCRQIAVDIGDGTLAVYADVLYKDLLPIPLRIDLSVQAAKALEVTITSVHVGEWFEIPAKTLVKLGVENHYSISLDELLVDTQITSIDFENEKIVLTGPFLRDFSQTVSPDMTADILLLYGMNNADAVNQASTCYRAGNAETCEQIVCDYIADAQSPVKAMARLLALCDTDAAAETINTLDAFRAHFFLPVSVGDVAAYRETYIESIASYNRKLETLLTTVREKYKALEIKLTRDAYVDTTTNEALSLAALCPDLGLSDSQFHPVLFIATEPLRSPFTADLPLFSEIPISPGLKLDMTRDYLRNDIGVMLVLPDGSTAMLYYALTGELVVQCLPKATAASLFAEFRVPKVLNLDLAVFATKRVRHDAPATDLSQYIVFLPQEIEEVWSARAE